MSVPIVPTRIVRGRAYPDPVQMSLATHFLMKLARFSLLLLACGSTLLPLTVWAQKAAAPEYLIGPGDVLRISVFQNPDLGLEARVAEDGAISYPLIGSV